MSPTSSPPHLSLPCHGSPPGYTLLELAVALTLMGLLLSAGLPPAHRLADGMAVRGAREAVAALASRSRSEGMRRGGARLHLDASGGVVRVVAGGVEWERVDVGSTYGVEIRLSGGREAAELYFDGLGIGRVASQTVELIRGRQVAVLVFSAYGRVRRR